jgi:hypothetical protein
MKIAFRIGGGGISSVTSEASSCYVWPREMVFLLLRKLEGVKIKEKDKRSAG